MRTNIQNMKKEEKKATLPNMTQSGYSCTCVCVCVCESTHIHTHERTHTHVVHSQPGIVFVCFKLN